MNSDRLSFSYFWWCYLCLHVGVSLFHVCVSQNFNDVSCIDDERQALLQFKRDLIDDANRLASWVEEDKNDCCKWDGIVCDNYTGHVNQINLSGLDGHCYLIDFMTTKESEEASKQMLGGNLSSSLLHLKQLRRLDLSCNDFRGIQVPSFIGSLGNLRYLNLSQSKFGGNIPPQLGNLSQLNVLSLGSFHYAVESTSMMNMRWLSSLRWLHHLDISGVDLSKAIDWFQVINTLPSLSQLHLFNCQLSDIHPDVPSLNITNLTLLDLSYNNFDTSVPLWIFSISSLVSLDLLKCNFHGPIPSSIDSFRNLTSLESLHVSENDFMNSSLVLKQLSSTIASNLVSLDISSCGISSSVLDSLHNLASLISLDLSRNQLTRTIHKSLGNFCNLRDVDFSDNNFLNITFTQLLESFFKCKLPRVESLFLWSSNIYGHFPDQLGRKLIHLEHLALRSNRISGPIPDFIGQLSSMKRLDLSRNLITGPIPYSIGRLLSLEMLVLSDNQLNGSLPDSLGQLSKLSRFDISNNTLNGVVTEAHFAKLVSLKYLNGKGNNLILRPRSANWIPPFQLRYLYLNSWVLGPQFPLWLQAQTGLEDLDISNTNISEYMPESFLRSFTDLNCLDMSKNHIQGTLLSIPTTLRLLDLSSNELSGKLTYLSNSSFPTLLDVSNNSFTGSLHELLCSNGVKETYALNLGNNHLSGVIPKCWENWPDLQLLNLQNNNLSGVIPTTLGTLSRLRSLTMRGNKISGSLPASLMNLTNLVILQLGRNELVGNIPTWIGTQLSSLRLLNLRSNNFDGIIPHELCHLSTIQILDLADNNLSGYIPRCFNNFSVLSGKEDISVDQFAFYIVYGGATIATDLLVVKGREDTYSTILQWVMLLDLSSNNLVGHIPSEVTALHELKSLNLSRNQLTGSIPETIGDMKTLQSFDLSINKLSGKLPMSLSRLSFLGSFNVSYNDLTGRIPSGTQLQSFSELCFVGNKLCGAPLNELCAVEASNRDQNEGDGKNGVEWELVVSILGGFVAGFWIVVAPLIVSKSWRDRCSFVYNVLHKYCNNMFTRWRGSSMSGLPRDDESFTQIYTTEAE